jgi:hypothetical protein
MFKSDNKQMEINLDNFESNSKIETKSLSTEYKNSLYSKYHDLKSGKGLNLFEHLKSNKIGNSLMFSFCVFIL